jgi:hypothetical protein
VTEHNAWEVVNYIRLLIADERLFLAEELVLKLEHFLDATAFKGSAVGAAIAAEIKGPMAPKLRALRDRVAICRQAFKDLESVREYRCWGHFGTVLTTRA